MIHIVRRVSVASGLLALVAWAAAIHADIPPQSSPACEGHAANAACIQEDGSAGVCVTHTDRRGRPWMSCEAAANECARLAVGAACHDNPGHASHCRVMTDAHTQPPVRACVRDDLVRTMPRH